MPRNRIKAALTAQGVTLTEIAADAGVSVSFASRVVSGSKRSLKVERAIAARLGQAVEELFPQPQRARRISDAEADAVAAHARARVPETETLTRAEIALLVKTREGRSQLREQLRTGAVKFPEEVAYAALDALDGALSFLDG